MARKRKKDWTPEERAAWERRDAEVAATIRRLRELAARKRLPSQQGQTPDG